MTGSITVHVYVWYILKLSLDEISRCKEESDDYCSSKSNLKLNDKMRKLSRISVIYNYLILFASCGVFCAIIVSVINRIEKIDNKMRLNSENIIPLFLNFYSSQISPYSTLADWVNVHAQSGLRIKVPKPIYFQV